MNQYEVIHEKVVIRTFWVDAEDEEEARKIIEEDSDSDEGLTDQRIEHDGVSSVVYMGPTEDLLAHLEEDGGESEGDGFAYHCDCKVWDLTFAEHESMQGGAKLFCKDCMTVLEAEKER